MCTRSYRLLSMALMLVAFCAVPAGCSKMPVELAIKPEHVNMLVSFDGEEDEYYEELKLEYKGRKVNSKKAKWSSDNPDIAEVDRFGWVTSHDVGTAKITAEYKGASACCTVKVEQKITSDTPGYDD